jgi:predicted nucleic acid-binding protein
MRFLDSNIWLYAAMRGPDPAKRRQAMAAIRAGNLAASIQVVNEVCFNLLRKAGYDGPQLLRVIAAFYRRAVILPSTRETITKAVELRSRYSLSFWDSQIAACALLAGCTVLESEDMQDGLVVDGLMTIRNPFKH